MQSLAIIVASILAAVTYGIVHDQITARICVEYFTIGHPPLFRFPTEDPTLLGFGWGVVATWWVGLLLGLPLAAAARWGRREKIAIRELYGPLAALLAITAVGAALSGVLGYQLAVREVVVLTGPLAGQIPATKHAGFVADLWAHTASYGIGVLGGLSLIAKTWRSRRSRADV